MVGVAIAARGVVGRQHVRPLLDQHLGKLRRELVLVEVGEPHLVSRPALPGDRAGVGVAQQDDARGPDGTRGRGQLVRAPPAEVTGGRCVRQPRFARRGNDEDDPVPLGDRSRERARRQQRLVVGVGVEGHHGERHRASTSGCGLLTDAPAAR